MPTAIIVLIIAAALFGLVAVASFHFYSIAVRRSRKDFLRRNKDLEQVFGKDRTEESGESAPPESAKEWLDAQQYETWTQTSEDGLRLCARFVPVNAAAAGVAILAHGYSAEGRTMAAFARLYHGLGYHVLMPDARGHGKSEGNYIGFGWHDRFDMLGWIQAVVGRNRDARIVLHGISMGAATVLMAGGELLPPQVNAIIADCGYTSVWDELSYQLRRIYHLPKFPLLYTTDLLTRLRAGYGFREASALAQTAKICTPVLFIHGDADTFVPFEMVHRLCDVCTAEKELYVVPGAGHGMAFSVNPAVYESRVSKFVGRCLVQQSMSIE